MVNDTHMSLSATDDEVFLFEDDEDNTSQKIQLTSLEFKGQIQETSEAWKLMIVDDDAEVHQATKLALRSFTYQGKPLTFISAFSGIEAKKLIAEHSDTAFILLDVVMETNDAGLRVIQYIREELKNQIVRVILRTGQPGDAPEESVILNYDINDYKLKVELTRQKLVTTAIAALRSYRDLITIQEKTAQLTKALHDLQQTQYNLVQKEKMSALGNLVTGIAHEINNPINFIAGNLKPAENYIQDLLRLITLYQQTFPHPGGEIEQVISEIDLDYLQEDLPKLISSLKEGSDRIRGISASLRIFSRGDGDRKVPFNVHEGLDSTLLILKHRLKGNEHHPLIEIVKDYGNLPPIKCFPGQLNQVFMNILANAIDALEETHQERTFRQIKDNPNRITIQTRLSPDQHHVLIHIQDNGLGMSENVKQKLFDYLFTTKPVGKGTGLGLAISRQIIEEKHNGKLTVTSELGKGTELTINIPVENGE
ncbi:histidine kinase [Nostoc linckia z18]|uniref:histidine kinase n=2 Tax=Nostoc linckia TaxID=92942 RepID=A0A9Q5ZC74_NOSLI|nr:ATP-binding protein [Nostoc linckia]PHK42685.1 histidine kinase [Nostoc linckia z15]PHK46631.1 histidine kinase [Nostoc linckia z16]PHJ60602.1 histidine kinase [Nostoc linckia z1]PHJ71212.1 histidine kinase [Nostoc linckia z2]PHJ72187.1 histidine kinase [Nostoc linckia z3]